jgi:hypothetical protein
LVSKIWAISRAGSVKFAATAMLQVAAFAGQANAKAIAAHAVAIAKEKSVLALSENLPTDAIGTSWLIPCQAVLLADYHI